jgi:CRP-like cAMP-binding protein
MKDSNRDIVDTLASLTLFGDLSRPQLEAVAHTFDEEWFSEGQRILRQGFTGTGFYVILEGEASVRIDGVDRATLGKGDFFGDISILLGEPPVADVVALRPLRCLVLGGPDTEPFLNAYPRVMYRMLQAVARRLRNANQWRS